MPQKEGATVWKKTTNLRRCPCWRVGRSALRRCSESGFKEVPSVPRSNAVYCVSLASSRSGSCYAVERTFKLKA